MRTVQMESQTTLPNLTVPAAVFGILFLNQALHSQNRRRAQARVENPKKDQDETKIKI